MPQLKCMRVWLYKKHGNLNFTQPALYQASRTREIHAYAPPAALPAYLLLMATAPCLVCLQLWAARSKERDPRCSVASFSLVGGGAYGAYCQGAIYSICLWQQEQHSKFPSSRGSSDVHVHLVLVHIYLCCAYVQAQANLPCTSVCSFARTHHRDATYSQMSLIRAWI